MRERSYGHRNREWLLPGDDLSVGTRLPLAEVALEADFANQGHLGNAFMRRYGRTPGATRRGWRPWST